MGNIQIDKAQFVAHHREEPDSSHQALWTFSIEEKDICFWGRYPDAASTAKRYAHDRGMTAGTIRLVDCTGLWRGSTKH